MPLTKIDASVLDTLNPPLSIGSGGTGLSTITANSVMLGNGTSAIQLVAPGTSGNVLKSNGTTWISAAELDLAIGVGQTWQNLAASRAIGTTYTNNTGKPIFVSVAIYCNNTTGYLTINGVIVTGHTGVVGYSQVGFIGGIVPNGGTYSVSGTSIDKWAELR